MAQKKSQPARRQAQDTPRGPSPAAATAACIVLILAAGIWAFSNSFAGVFMGDDVDAIVQNPHLRTLIPTRTPPDTTLAGRPVSAFTFGLNYALAPAEVRNALQPRDLVAQTPDPTDPFFRNMWGYHAVNLLIHLLAALTLFGVLRRTFISPALAERFSRAATPLALAATLIWVVHPLQTASVTYIVQRVESLMGLFYLLTIYGVIRAAESGFTNRTWIGAAVAACALGMGTKETMVTAPIVAALWIHVCWPSVKLTREARTLVLGLAATWIVLIALSLTPNRSLSVGFTLGGWSWWLYLRTQAAVIVHYLQLAFWPVQLVFLYQWMPVQSWTEVIPQFLLLAMLGAATLVGLIRRSPWALAGASFFLILAPSSSILPIASEVAAEHRMYLPLAAVIVPLVVAASWLASRTAIGKAPLARPVTWVAVAAIVIALGARTRARNEDYRHFDIMAPTIVAAEPHNVVAQVLVGTALVRRKQYAEGEQHLRAALASPLPPGGVSQPYAMAQLFLGISAGSQNQHERAVEHLQQAIRLDPALPEPAGLLAESYLKLGRVADGLAALDAGIAAFPKTAQWLARSAWVRATTTDPSLRNGARAVQDAEKALAITGGSDLVGLLTLAAAQAEAQNFPAALATLARAEALPGVNAEMRARLNTYRNYFTAKQPIRIASW